MDWVVLTVVMLIGLPVTYHFLRDADVVLGPATIGSPSLAERVRTELAVKYSLVLWAPTMWFFVRIPPLLRRSRETPSQAAQATMTVPVLQGIIREVAIALFGGSLVWIFYPELWVTMFYHNDTLLYWCYFFGDGDGFWAAFYSLALASLICTGWPRWFFCLLAAAFMFEQTQHWIWGCFGRVFVGYHGTPYTLWVLFGDIVALLWIGGIVTWKTKQALKDLPPRPNSN